jgi:hypothetical protein
MKIREYSWGSREREVLIGCITSDTVVNHVAAVWREPGLFESKFSNVIGNWCVEHATQYRKAPGEKIQRRFEAYRQKARDEDTISLIEALLETLSGEYERYSQESNSAYLIDLAGKHFNEVKTKKAILAAQSEMDSGDYDAASKLLQENARTIELGSSNLLGDDPFNDEEGWELAFSHEQTEALFKPQGPVGDFFGDEFSRDCFVAFAGPEKRGKTWILTWLVWEALKARRRVAYYQIGDMMKPHIYRRLGMMFSKRPRKPKTVNYPKRIHPPKAGEQYASVEHEEITFDEPLTAQLVKPYRMKFAKRYLKSQNCYFRNWFFPAGHFTLEKLKEVTERTQQELAWTPDIVVIDYADLFGTPGITDPREKVDHVWKGLRGFSAELHGCVITATQTNRKSYEANLITMEHTSEDKRKLSHVTACIGINQTSQEKTQGIMRFNMPVRREEENTSHNVVHIAGCLGVGRPVVRSCFSRYNKVETEKVEEK